MLVYDEPPGWYYPVRESLGAALSRAASPQKPRSSSGKVCAEAPEWTNAVWSPESLKVQNKTQELEWVTREFQIAWKNADIAVRIEDL